MSAAGHRPDEHALVGRVLAHPHPVAEQGTAGERRRGVDGEHPDLAPAPPQGGDQRGRRRRLADPGRARQPHDMRPARVRREPGGHVAQQRAPGRRVGLDQRDQPRHGARLPAPGARDEVRDVPPTHRTPSLRSVDGSRARHVRCRCAPSTLRSSTARRSAVTRSVTSSLRSLSAGPYPGRWRLRMWRKPRLTLSPTRAGEDHVTRPTRRNAISRLHSGHDDLIPGCTGHRRRSCGYRRRRPGRGDRLVRRHARPGGHAHRDQRGAGGPRGHAVGPRRRGRRDPAPGPAAPGLADREVPRPQRARASSSWPTG